MSSNEYWIKFFSLATVVMIVAGVLLTTSFAHTDTVLAELVKGGADPIKLRCMRLPSGTSDPICIATVSKGN